MSNESLFTCYEFPLALAGVECNNFFSKLTLLLRGKQQNGCLKYTMAGMEQMQYMPQLWAHSINAVHYSLNFFKVLETSLFLMFLATKKPVQRNETVQMVLGLYKFNYLIL